MRGCFSLNTQLKFFKKCFCVAAVRYAQQHTSTKMKNCFLLTKNLIYLEAVFAQPKIGLAKRKAERRKKTTIQQQQQLHNQIICWIHSSFNRLCQLFTQTFLAASHWRPTPFNPPIQTNRMNDTQSKCVLAFVYVLCGNERCNAVKSIINNRALFVCVYKYRFAVSTENPNNTSICSGFVLNDLDFLLCACLQIFGPLCLLSLAVNVLPRNKGNFGFNRRRFGRSSNNGPRIWHC